MTPILENCSDLLINVLLTWKTLVLKMEQILLNNSSQRPDIAFVMAVRVAGDLGSSNIFIALIQTKNTGIFSGSCKSEVNKNEGDWVFFGENLVEEIIFLEEVGLVVDASDMTNDVSRVEVSVDDTLLLKWPECSN